MNANILSKAYLDVRRLTETLSAPLGAEDQTVQSMPDVSPTKWHRAHTSWFFETFILGTFTDWKSPYPRYRELFNSYYEQVGCQFPREQRGVLSRPTVSEVSEYRGIVDNAMLELLSSSRATEDVLALVELGLHHEQQHQELLLMDAKHVLSCNPLDPCYSNTTLPSIHRSTPEHSWLSFDGGLANIGHQGEGFHFDNEGPQHRVWLDPYQVSRSLVTASQWLTFMEDDGYQRPELWLADGWRTVQREGWTAPLYWTKKQGEWNVFTLGGTRQLIAHEPVCHVSFYEADAYCRWLGARLPTEAEWERASVISHDPKRTRLFDVGALHPWPPTEHSPANPSSLDQMFGEVWQWTGSAYRPYPGYVPPTNAVGEYNGKFMNNQYVLRGGSAFTPSGHVRSTYRNFYPPHSRWMLSGVRLAKDL